MNKICDNFRSVIMEWRGGVHINNKTITVTLHAPHALRVNELDLGIHTCICTHTHIQLSTKNL